MFAIDLYSTGLARTASSAGAEFVVFDQEHTGWGLDQIPSGEGDVIFPLRVSELLLFGPDVAEGSEVSCRVAIREVSRHQVRARMDFPTTVRAAEFL